MSKNLWDVLSEVINDRKLSESTKLAMTRMLLDHDAGTENLENGCAKNSNSIDFKIELPAGRG